MIVPVVSASDLLPGKHGTAEFNTEDTEIAEKKEPQSKERAAA
jgi:hypothetical protein